MLGRATVETEARLDGDDAMGYLQRWWRRLTGTGPDPVPASRPVTASLEPDDPSGLKIEEEMPRKRRSRVGAAGFDPYSSDAGHSKPHCWERVDHD
jgi:hypothetical protein